MVKACNHAFDSNYYTNFQHTTSTKLSFEKIQDTVFKAKNKRHFSKVQHFSYQPVRCVIIHHPNSTSVNMTWILYFYCNTVVKSIKLYNCNKFLHSFYNKTFYILNKQKVTVLCYWLGLFKGLYLQIQTAWSPSLCRHSWDLSHWNPEEGFQHQSPWSSHPAHHHEQKPSR